MAEGTPDFHTDAQLEGDVNVGSVAIANGADAAQGNTSDPDTANTIIGRLKKLVSLLAGGLPAALGANGGLKVEGVASGVAQPVSGPVTDAQLRAAAVPTSLAAADAGLVALAAALETVNDAANATAGTATSTADNTVTNASESVLASNASRKAAIIQVVSGGNARVRLDGGTATVSNGTQLVAGGPPLVVTMPFVVTGAITAIREGAVDAVVHVTEIA